MMDKGCLKALILFYMFQALLGNVCAYLLGKSAKIENCKQVGLGNSNYVEEFAECLLKEYDAYYLKNKDKLHNVARGKPARQSTAFINYGPERAVDGFPILSCSHTLIRRDEREWWRVDLQDLYRVYYMDITQRNNCCGQPLHDVYIDFFDGHMLSPETKSTACYHTPSFMKSPIVSLRCTDGPQNARIIQIANGFNLYLAMCDVQVYAKLLEIFQMKNVAKGKPTAQSSTYDSRYESKLAVDGVTNPQPLGLCAMTKVSSATAQQWWQTDLEGIYDVYSITITPRFYCLVCNFVYKTQHSWTFDVDVYNRLPGETGGNDKTSCLKHQHLVDFTVYSQACNPLAPKGRVVRIVGENGLILCEVEVNAFPYLYGFPPD